MLVRAMKAGAVEFLTNLSAIKICWKRSRSPSQDRPRRDDERVVAERAYPVRHADAGERSAQRSRQTKPPVEELG